MGGFVIPPDLAKIITPIVAGGTGVMSELLDMPEETPMRFEAGTPNLMGYYSLAASLQWIKRIGVEKIHEREMSSYSYLLAGLEDFAAARVLGTHDARSTVAVLAFDVPGVDIGTVAYRLDSKHHVVTRCGLHCAPLANQTLGTFPTGSIRLSPGYFTSKTELDYALCAVEESIWYVTKKQRLYK